MTDAPWITYNVDYTDLYDPLVSMSFDQTLVYENVGIHWLTLKI